MKEFVPFHHDPAHADDMLETMIADTVSEVQPSYAVIPGKEGTVINVGGDK